MECALAQSSHADGIGSCWWAYEKVSKLCHSKGVLVCIDGTFAIPLNQKVLALGADLVLHYVIKFIGGHNDILAGCRHEDIASSCTTTEFNNIKDGKVLEAHPWVKRFYHPGLPSHSEHEIAKQQMTGFGGVVSFEVDRDLMTTIKFVDAFKIPNIAPSLGGCESIADQPTIMSYWDLTQAERRKYGIEDNLVRFSFGVEDFKDLKADILQAPRNHIKASIAFLIFIFKIFDCSLQTFWSGLVILVFQLALISKVSVVFQLGSSLLE
ncbi:Pyridoxal phosphate (PLP)-dependent transferases superfamily protein, putative [Theobroma cacao]|uniref:Pyridoxal phosphate (PLP)-dependent transferases superfamily protein, putative n=1 Tax=Theobroma cacao TaxID=3641 RepID=A0A061GCK3_THECC|nr:Pyridoxal phosphate (PLP)-dependent transferases superfamily protein, putative [Theobroma cacao]